VIKWLGAGIENKAFLTARAKEKMLLARRLALNLIIRVHSRNSRAVLLLFSTR
jgi:hypothetical protein